MDFKLTAVLLMTAVFLFRLLCCRIRMRSADNPIPPNVSDVYDSETYTRWRAYRTEKNRLELARSCVSYAVSLLLILFDIYAAFAKLFPEGLFMQMLAVLLLMALSDIAELPFSWRDTMGIEEKYGFNRSDRRTFWMDRLKEFLIGLVLSLAIGSLLMGLHRALGDWLILAFAVVMTLLTLLITFLFPYLSMIFNKFTPLEEGELREKLSALLTKHGYKVRDIKVMDASRRSTKSNAYFAGFGKMKTIVLYDTLISTMTADEICAVFAHELAHGLHKDTLKNQAMSFLQLAVLGLLGWMTLRSPDVFSAFGFDGINYGFALLLIMSVEFAFISPLFSLPVNALSRRAEFRADAMAAEEGYGPQLISSLKKLGRENFSELAPSPMLVLLEYSHPPLSKRIDAIEHH